MNGSSVVTTTATSMSTAGGAQLLEWLWQGAPSPIPEGVALFLAAASAPLIHLAYRAIAKWLGSSPATPSPR